MCALFAAPDVSRPIRRIDGDNPSVVPPAEYAPVAEGPIVDAIKGTLHTVLRGVEVATKQHVTDVVVPRIDSAVAVVFDRFTAHMATRYDERVDFLLRDNLDMRQQIGAMQALLQEHLQHDVAAHAAVVDAAVAAAAASEGLVTAAAAAAAAAAASEGPVIAAAAASEGPVIAAADASEGPVIAAAAASEGPGPVIAAAAASEGQGPVNAPAAAIEGPGPGPGPVIAPAAANEGPGFAPASLAPSMDDPYFEFL